MTPKTATRTVSPTLSSPEDEDVLPLELREPIEPTVLANIQFPPTNT